MKRSALLALALAACGGSDDRAGAVPAPVPTACAEGERSGAEGACELVAANASACAPGSRPVVGSETCAPVGPTACADGFERDASGWGCAPVLPAQACTGATRPGLGERACLPVGDCAGAFPPPGAVLVDPSLDPASVDATHVRTLEDAVAVAPPGSTIALADGEHAAAPVTFTQPLALVGRCAAKARLVPAAAGGAGLTLQAKATLRGLTLAGQATALSVTGGGELVAEDIVVEGARARALFAQRGASVVLRRSVVRGTTPLGASDQTVAVLVGSAADVLLEDTAVLDSTDAAVAATDSVATSVRVERSVIQGTRSRADGKGGAAVRAFEGARVAIVESALLDASGMAILTFRRNKPPPEVTVLRSVIRGTIPTRETGTAIGTAINAAYDAKVVVEDSTVSDSQGHGLYVAEKASLAFTRSVVVRVSRTTDFSGHGGTALKGGTLALEDSAVVRSSALGLGGWSGGRVTLARSLVRDVGGDVVEGFPMGQGLNATAQSSIEATDSAIVDALEIAVAGSNRESTIRLDGVLVTRTGAAPAPRFGHGVLSVDLAGITVARSVVERQPGVALFFAAGGGIVQRSLVRDNAVAVHVQEGSALVEVAQAPEVAPESELVVTTDTRFSGNTTRTGSGVLPLPAPLEEP